MNATPLPQPCDHALLIGRIWQPNTGPVLVAVTSEAVLDLSPLAATCSDLLEQDQAAIRVQQFMASGRAHRLGDTAAILVNSTETGRDPALPWFIAP